MPLLIDIVFFIIVGILGTYVYKKSKANFTKFIFFLLWFLMGLALHLQIFPLNMTVADRWFYFTMVGLLGIIGIGIEPVTFSSKKLRFISYVIAILIIALLSVRTIERNTNWVSALVLYNHDRQVHTNYSIENRLGGEYLALKQYDKALEHFVTSTKMFPTQISLGNVAFTYESVGNVKKAKEYYLKAFDTHHYTSIPQDHVKGIYLRLASVLFITDDFNAALPVLKEGIEEYPNSGEMWANLAFCEYKLKNREEALVAADRARMLLPNESTYSLYNKILNNEEINVQRR